MELNVLVACMLVVAGTSSASFLQLLRTKKTSDPNSWNHGVPDNNCHIQNSVFDHGEMFVINGNPCIKYQCNRGTGYPVQVSCKDSHNRCHAVGATVRGGFNGCLLQQCHRDGVFRQVPEDPYKCKDINNVCRRPQIDRFPVNVNGYHVNNCSCQIVSGNVRYLCPQTGWK